MHSLITPGVPLNCVVLHMVGLSRLILWILLIPCNLTNSLQFPPRLASPASPSSCCCWMTGNLRTLKCWTGGSGVSGVFVSNSALSKAGDVKAAVMWPVHVFCCCWCCYLGSCVWSCQFPEAIRSRMSSSSRQLGADTLVKGHSGAVRWH